MLLYYNDLHTNVLSLGTTGDSFSLEEGKKTQTYQSTMPESILLQNKIASYYSKSGQSGDFLMSAQILKTRVIRDLLPNMLKINKCYLTTERLFTHI